MMNSDAKDFLIFVKGYHQLFCGPADLIKYDSRSGVTSALPGHSSPTVHTKSGGVDFNKVRLYIYTV